MLRASAALILLAISGSACADPVLSLREMRSAGVVLQQWDSSCGAAALATVLTFDLADPVSERAAAHAMLVRGDEVRVKSRGGFSLLDMKRFAEGRGHAVSAFGNLALPELLELGPAIVPINEYGYGHFVVVRGMANGEVRLADPAFGNRRMPVERFLEVWQGGVAFAVRRAQF